MIQAAGSRRIPDGNTVVFDTTLVLRQRLDEGVLQSLPDFDWIPFPQLASVTAETHHDRNVATCYDFSGTGTLIEMTRFFTLQKAKEVTEESNRKLRQFSDQPVQVAGSPGLDQTLPEVFLYGDEPTVLKTLDALYYPDGYFWGQKPKIVPYVSCVALNPRRSTAVREAAQRILSFPAHQPAKRTK